MGEAMAEVEQGTLAAPVRDIAGDDARLGPNGGADRLFAKVAVRGKDAAAIGLAPCEEGGVVDQAIFDDFGIARAQLPLIERIEEGRVGDDQRGLMKGADQVLLPEGVDRGLAADRAVGLGEQGRRQMDDRAAALEQRGGEAGKIADASAAERDDWRFAARC